MKRLLLVPLLLTLLVASCSSKKKYNSYREANDACKEWADKGGYYIQKYSAQKAKKYDSDEELTFFPAQEYKHSLRFCQEEKETKQVLGIQTTNRKNGDIGFPEGDVPCK